MYGRGSAGGHQHHCVVSPVAVAVVVAREANGSISTKRDNTTTTRSMLHHVGRDCSARRVDRFVISGTIVRPILVL